MAIYDMACGKCDTVVEVKCAIADCDTQHCATCNTLLDISFNPTSNILIKESFRHSFSELFGVTSEKDYLKEHPELERVNPSTFVSAADKRRRRVEKANKDVADIEKAIRANRSLVGNGDPSKEPIKYTVGTGEPND